MKTNKINQKGFSLIELLVVVIIIGIIAAIAIPSLLSSRRAANEASAVANLRTIHTSNATFAATQNTNGYFGATLAALSTTPALLDSSWTGTPVKNTFTYTYTVDSGATPTLYCVQAKSADVNAKDYAVGTDGTVYSGAHNAVSCAAGVRTGGIPLGS